MFEEYLIDAKFFYEQAIKTTESEKAKSYYRASVFCAASSLEAFVNFIGDTVETSGILSDLEIAYLNDKALEVSPSSGEIKTKVKYNPIDGKVKFIIKRLSVPISVDSDSNWSNFLEFKKLRDSLIHSKELEDNSEPSDYRGQIKKGLNSNIYIIDKISKTIFTKGLRRKLLDLQIE